MFSAFRSGSFHLAAMYTFLSTGMSSGKFAGNGNWRARQTNRRAHQMSGSGPEVCERPPGGLAAAPELFEFHPFKLPPSEGVSSTDRSFFFGRRGDQLVAADWNEDGVDTVGVYRSSDNTFYLRYTNTGGVADELIVSPFPIGRPIAGRFG